MGGLNQLSETVSQGERLAIADEGSRDLLFSSIFYSVEG